jgi:hypothetical protein
MQSLSNAGVTIITAALLAHPGAAAAQGADTQQAADAQALRQEITQLRRDHP